MFAPPDVLYEKKLFKSELAELIPTPGPACLKSRLATEFNRKPARLAGKLLEIGLKLELSQNELIKRMGQEDELEQQYISKFEHGDFEPALYVLCAYADLVNTSLDSLARDDLDLPKGIAARAKRTRPVPKRRPRKR